MQEELGPKAESMPEFNAVAQEISTLYPRPPKEFTFSGNSGSINDFRTSEQLRKIGVVTDCGVVASKKQEIMTINVVGCAAVYLEGAKSNTFFHLTPNSRLGYRYFKFNNPAGLVQNTTDKIVASLPAEEDRASMQGIMVVNIGSENGGDFDYRKILADAERLADSLRKEGINIKVVEVPLDSTSVYATPEKPGKVFVCGVETSVNPEGRLDRSKNTKGFWVDIDSNENTQYVTHNFIKKAA